ncbi:uncharacterized protein LOC142978495 [Anticarsia gemmatalis]|uniref:uncharacterized protein LOC142978495 n=1 Tax=Anticarsia gemmatalis TaxID=129554 RepID=UPI003F7756DF
MTDKLPENLQESIESIATKHNFINYDIVSKNLSTDGGSYMGVLYEIDIKGKTETGDEEINIFAKNIVENIQMSIYSIPGVFETEAWVYTELAKVFTELQIEANIPIEERFKMAASFDECNPKSIILEHLGKKGFKLYHRMECIPLDYAELSIIELAKFHALSFVIKEKRPDYYKEKIITKKQPYNFGADWYAFVDNMANYSINCLSSDVKEKKKDILLQKTADYPKYMNDTSGIGTLCHGDYKMNNIMAKEVNGKLSEVVPIDFQILNYGNPILDFIYFIFHGTDREFRRNHLASLKDLYYGTMKGFLQKFGIDIEAVLPRNLFEKIYKEKLDFGLMVLSFYGPFLFAVEGNAPDVTTEELSTLNFKVDDRFTKRYREIVDEFIQWGYI